MRGFPSISRARVVRLSRAGFTRESQLIFIVFEQPTVYPIDHPAHRQPYQSGSRTNRSDLDCKCLKRLSNLYCHPCAVTDAMCPGGAETISGTTRITAYLNLIRRGRRGHTPVTLSQYCYCGAASKTQKTADSTEWDGDKLVGRQTALEKML